MLSEATGSADSLYQQPRRQQLGLCQAKQPTTQNFKIMQRGGTPRVSACWAASKLWTKSKAAVPWTCAALYKGVATHCVCPVMRISCTDLSAAPAGVPSRPPAPPCLPAAAAGWTAATAAGAAGSQTAPQMPAGPVLNISGSHSQQFQMQGSCLQCSWALKSSASPVAVCCGRCIHAVCRWAAGSAGTCNSNLPALG